LSVLILFVTNADAEFGMGEIRAHEFHQHA
jgi:hypothetical protein